VHTDDRPWKQSRSWSTSPWDELSFNLPSLCRSQWSSSDLAGIKNTMVWVFSNPPRSCLSLMTAQRILREINLRVKLNHPNIIQLLGITTEFQGGNFPSFVFPWMPGGDLHCYIAYHGAGIEMSTKLSLVSRVNNLLVKWQHTSLGLRHCLWSHLSSVLFCWNRPHANCLNTRSPQVPCCSWKPREC
jgi:hypothetical protein